VQVSELIMFAMELIPASVENDLALSLKRLLGYRKLPLIVSTFVELYVTEKRQVRP
jgi:hypothetical protein